MLTHLRVCAIPGQSGGGILMRHSGQTTSRAAARGTVSRDLLRSPLQHGLDWPAGHRRARVIAVLPRPCSRHRRETQRRQIVADRSVETPLRPESTARELTLR